MKRSFTARSIPVLIAALLVTGCASGEVSEDGGSTTPPPATTETTPTPTAPSEETFSATTLTGANKLTVTVPEGFTAMGVDEAVTEFDLITITRDSDESGESWHQLVFVDTNVGVDAAATRDSFRATTQESDFGETVTDLDTITLDGVEFYGIEAAREASLGTMRVQWWFGDLSDTVLQLYIVTMQEDDMMDELHGILDSLEITSAS